MMALLWLSLLGWYECPALHPEICPACASRAPIVLCSSAGPFSPVQGVRSLVPSFFEVQAFTSAYFVCVRFLRAVLKNNDLMPWL